MIDLSHSNSEKDFKRQVNVCHAVAEQIAGGDDRIMGVMIESHLKEGRQDLLPGKELAYGQSITDACIGWEDTVQLLDELAESVRGRKLKTEARD
jgi:3-deoxy-7-phosphoheptulonate synthase